MATPKGKDKLEISFDEVIKEIGINGKSLLKAIEGKMSANTFYDLIKDEKKLERYARATDDRADLIADEILEISDNGSSADNVAVQRDRLRVDSRKWLLAKLKPKKYGDKLDVAHSGGIILQFPKEFKNV
jgi:hypothetical protein